MLQSQKFTSSKITIDDKEYDMEYERNNLNANSDMSFGNIYFNKNEPLEFTITTFKIGSLPILQ